MDLNLKSFLGLRSPVLGVCWTLTGVSTLLFSLRLTSRLFIKRGTTGWDDAVISLAWALEILGDGLTTAAFSLATDITARNATVVLPKVVEFVLLTNDILVFGLSLSKFAVATLLFRVFNPTRRGAFLLLGSTMSLIVLYFIFAVLILVQCSPVQAQWNPTKYPRAKCWGRGFQINGGYVMGALGVLVDLLIVVYPNTRIWKLQMGITKKVELSILMSLGLIATGFSLVKIAQLKRLADVGTQPDRLLYESVSVGIWTNIENNSMIIAACIQTVSPFMRFAKDQISQLLSSVKSSKGPYSEFSDKTTAQLSHDRLELSEQGRAARVEAI